MSAIEPHVRSKQILVVDDDDDEREVIEEVLEGAGFSVSKACNGKLALDLMRASSDIGLVVLDLEMPVMSGIELLACMKADERLRSVPVLILSGTDKSKAPTGRPVIEFISKPCDMARFVRSVSACIERDDGVVAATPRP